jgi:hypothetical protein
MRRQLRDDYQGSDLLSAPPSGGKAAERRDPGLIGGILSE